MSNPVSTILGLFEAGAAEGRKVKTVTGGDLAAFADHYRPDHSIYEQAWRNALNHSLPKIRD